MTSMRKRTCKRWTEKEIRQARLDTRVAQEQGRWSAQTALKIMDGASPDSIPVTHNVEGNLIINMKVAKAAGIRVTPNFLRKASRVIQ